MRRRVGYDDKLGDSTKVSDNMYVSYGINF